MPDLTKAAVAHEAARIENALRTATEICGGISPRIVRELIHRHDSPLPLHAVVLDGDVFWTGSWEKLGEGLTWVERFHDDHPLHC